MNDYMVEWASDAEDVSGPMQAAQEAWEDLRRSDSIANAFIVTDTHQMAVVVDLHLGDVSDPVWTPGLKQVAELAQWMHDHQWEVNEIIRMIGAPQKYADEYAEMVRDREFDKVAVGPEEIDDSPDDVTEES